MVQMEPFDPQPIPLVPCKLRWYQYSIRSLLVLMTLTAVFCTYWVYYRPTSATGTVTYQVLLLKAAPFDNLLSGKTRLPVEGSPYACSSLDGQEIDSFLKDKRAVLQAHGTTKTVHTWPSQADSYICESFRSLPIKKSMVWVKENDGIKSIANVFPAIDNDSMAGFMGFRRTGLTYRLRLDYAVSYQAIPDDELESVQDIPKPLRVSGSIFYDGALPKGKLVFFAPFGNDKYHVIIFVVKPAE
jgi:hypothetical protein